jgi:hypothetical protein
MLVPGVRLLYRGADKSVARPGRKQVTATEDFDFNISYYLLTYLLHAAESFLRSWLVLQLVKKFPVFSEPEGSSPYSQAPATCPYPEPTPSSPHNSLPLPEDTS